MRAILILGIIGLIGWYAVRGATGRRDGDGVLSAVVSSTVSKVGPDPGAQSPLGPAVDMPASVPSPFAAASPGAPLVAPVGGPSSSAAASVFVRVHRFTDRMPPDLTTAMASLGVQIVPDFATRSVAVRGSEADVIAACDALVALDLAAESCTVRTWAVYVDRNIQRGWDLTAAIKAITGGDIGLDLGAGRAALNLSGDEIAAALNVIADGAAVDVVQRPHLVLTHGEVSEVQALSEVPLPTVSVTGTGVSQSGVTYRKVGLQLRVTPDFLGRGRVRLKVEQENGLIGSNVNLGGGLSAPVIETQRVASTVELAIGQTVVLGGVSSDRLVAKKGLLRDVSERQKGFLYVVLSTSADVPRAIPVGSLALPSPVQPVPLTIPSDAADIYLDSEFPLLPPKGWETQEKTFIRGHPARR